MSPARVTVTIDRLALRNAGDQGVVRGLIAREVERQLPPTAWSRAVAAATEKAVTDRIANRGEARR